MMTYQALKANSHKEYLGYCDTKGYIYSVCVDVNTYVIVALQANEVTTLLTYKVKGAN